MWGLWRLILHFRIRGVVILLSLSILFWLGRLVLKLLVEGMIISK